MKSWIDHKEELEKYAHLFDKSIILKDKEGWFIKTLCWIIALGNRDRYVRYMTNFAQTIGNYHFYPREWTKDRVERVIPHEGRHTYQARVCSLGIHPLLGLPIMAIIYGLIFFPVGLALGRVYLELDADTEVWRQLLLTDTPNAATIIRNRATDFASTVASRDYFWPLPTAWVHKLFNDRAENLIRELL
jgi:hypothetical protein